MGTSCALLFLGLLVCLFVVGERGLASFGLAGRPVKKELEALSCCLCFVTMTVCSRYSLSTYGTCELAR